MTRPKYSEDKVFSLSLYDLEGSPDEALSVFTNFITQAKNCGIRQPHLSVDYDIHGDNITKLSIEGWVPMPKEKILVEKRKEQKLQEKIAKNERKHYEKLKLKYKGK